MKLNFSLKNSHSDKRNLPRRRGILALLSLSFLLYAGSVLSEEMVTVSSSQKLRKRGSPRSGSIGKMIPGKKALLIKNYRHWSLVNYNGKRGFVRKDRLVAAEEDSYAEERDNLDQDYELENPEELESDCPNCLTRQYQDSVLRGSIPRDLSDWEEAAPRNPIAKGLTINVNRQFGKTRSDVFIRFLRESENEAHECRRTSTSVRRRTGAKIRCGNRAKGMCYQAVKNALVDSGMTKHYLPGNHAYEAHTKGYLKRAGFTNFIGRHTAYNAPVGCVLVYKGGRSGHIETKTRGGYCSDFCRKSPISTLLRRELVGVYCK
ncbi:MAG: hypothetical protein IPK68_11985 [Bdellovibrionales bacterium]|nr:hypothetical protein [Bdellovibrionales bacterium]